MADHEDYLSGEAPMAHSASHESLGSDEISIAGLAGESAALAAHKILPSIHHLRYTDVEAQIVADAEIGIHAAHQDAPALIETHRLVAGAHHAKYTDAEARAVHSPISIPPSAFVPYYDTYDWAIIRQTLKNRTALTTQYFVAPVYFPQGVVTTKVIFYAYRDDAASVISLVLSRAGRTGGLVGMIALVADWTTGWSSINTTTIAYATVDNDLYSYVLRLRVDPNDSVDDVAFSGVVIEFTG
jgi:hypothetical protein